VPLRVKIINYLNNAFVRLRYFLGGDRPSQTNVHKLFLLISKIKKEEWSFIFRFNTTTYYYTKFLTLQLKIIVKVHGVFPSN